MTDLAIYTDPGAMAAQWQYAETVSRAALLPAAYRGKPADVLIAIGLGQAVGIPPAQALYEIYVVNGRPSPSANLMAALVRRSGHKLRIDGDTAACTATLVRADDPGHPFSATWPIEQARAAGLAGKDTWKQYPAAMLRARAIAEVVRMGASEAVLGMEYAAEEQRDVDAPVAGPRKKTGADSLRAALQPVVDVTDAVVVEEEGITPSQSRALHAAFRAAGVEDRAVRLDYCQRVIGRALGSSKDLASSEASRVLDALAADAQADGTLGIGGDA